LANAAQGAQIAPTSTRGRSGIVPRPFRLALLAGLLVLSALAVETPAATQAHTATTSHHMSQAQRIVRIASSHIGARFRLGTEGPRTFDCSGLIYRVYKQAGLLNKIGGMRRQAAGYYFWFKHHNRANRSNPKVGDLVIWKEKGKIAHSGIYVGHGHVISALINPWGVKRTHINTLHAKFFAFLHVNITR
jgi:cell wall-associated NlpC family hydrolase